MYVWEDKFGLAGERRTKLVIATEPLPLNNPYGMWGPRGIVTALELDQARALQRALNEHFKHK